MHGAIEISDCEESASADYSICTLVTDRQQYQGMLESFQEAGFTEGRCEFIYIDNSEANKCDAYDGINRFLQVARGKYIILCHQDVVLHDDNIDRLNHVITELDKLDEHWAVLGNAGGVMLGKKAVRITDPFYGENAIRGSFPARVVSLDENFILVRRSANLGLSRDIGGFHMYGTDLCVIADVLGYSAYVVDFHLHHVCGEVMKSIGSKAIEKPMSFNSIRKRFIKKYQRAFRPRWLQTTCTRVHISGSKIGNFFGNRKITFSVIKRVYRFLKV